MELKNINGYIFDMDGVITKTDELHYGAWQTIFAEFGKKLKSSDHKFIRGIERKKSFLLLLEEYDISISEKDINKYVARKNDLYVDSLSGLKQSDLLPGILETLKHLKSINKKIALASISRNAQTIINKTGIGEYFDYIVDPAKIDNLKPAPDVFEKAYEKIGLTPSECVVIEDSQSGIEGANTAGTKVIGINWGNELDNCDIQFVDTELFSHYIKENS